MLDSQEFDFWCKALNLSQSARTLVEQIRRAAPSRRVQGYQRNVSGYYPSRKMRVTIQFESHHNELARIYELEKRFVKKILRGERAGQEWGIHKAARIMTDRNHAKTFLPSVT